MRVRPAGLLGGLAVLLVLAAGCGQRVPHVPSQPGLVVAATPTEVVSEVPSAVPQPVTEVAEVPTAPATVPAASASGPSEEPTESGGPSDASVPPTEPGSEPRPEPTEGEPSEHVAGDPGALLWDRSFRSTAVWEDDRRRPLVDGIPIDVSFSKRPKVRNTMGWHASCNWIGGDVDITQTRLIVGQGESTAMGCEENRAEQDDWMTAFFTSDPRWRMEDDGTLVIYSEQIRMQFERKRG